LALTLAALEALAGVASAAGETPTARTAPAMPAARATMLAVRLHGYGDVSNLRVERIAQPAPGPGEVLVRVRAASVNPYDWKFREGNLRRFFDPPMPLIPGIDFAGVVERVGDGVAQWAPGSCVYGFVADGAPGAYAEFVVVPATNLAPKPAAMSFEEAAGIPVASLTAWKSLFVLGQLEPGQRVLLQGASGAVGLAAIQLARGRGAQVTAVASTANQALMREFGAQSTIDYRTQRVADLVSNQDLALDAVDARTALDSMQALRPGGMLLTLNAPPDGNACAARKLRCAMVPNFRTTGDEFAQVAKLVDARRLRMHVGRTLPLERAAEAQTLSKSGGVGGKIVLVVADGPPVSDTRAAD
jgi:NADPH:quinone reductase-like Zn-dependent oxidoreductase